MLMKHARTLFLLIPFALAWYMYRELPGRSFAADDFQWLLNVRDLAFSDLLAQAWNPLAQQHFYRPMVWLLMWGQIQWFGLDARPFHLVSLGLHAMNAMLVGLLLMQLTTPTSESQNLPVRDQSPTTYQILIVLTIVLLHPAPFEAVVWVSAQSELVGALLLLLAVYLWVGGVSLGRSVLATIILGLAMLTKESAILGLPLMLLFGSLRKRAWFSYLPPMVLSSAFIWLQLIVSQQNRVLVEGRYGIGWQLLTNPLRSLALIVAPLPGTERAENEWLVPVGGVILLLLLGGMLVAWRKRATGQHTMYLAVIAALLLTLAPTAPFLSPPDSRYLYLPVAFAALLVSLLVRAGMRRLMPAKRQTAAGGSQRFLGDYIRLLAILLAIGVAVTAAWWAIGEGSYREWAFSAGTGPGASLWHTLQPACGEAPTARIILIEPPIAPPHAEAIVALACGREPETLIIGRDGLEAVLREDSLVIAFPGGSAAIEQRR
jgi:hypothetical protein